MKMAKNPKSNKPSARLMTSSGLLSSSMSQLQKNRAKDAKMQRGISCTSVFRVTTIGATIEVQPTIISVLKILLPTTLPMAMSALPLSAEDTDTVSSGAEVPKATMVSPITMSEM